MDLHKDSFRRDDLSLIKRLISSKNIKLGDLVLLNSGGSDMLVVDLGNNDLVRTAWRDRLRQERRHEIGDFFL